MISRENIVLFKIFKTWLTSILYTSLDNLDVQILNIYYIMNNVLAIYIKSILTCHLKYLNNIILCTLLLC